jgi:TetR/AcrR family transcriptional repressor of nem operon
MFDSIIRRSSDPTFPRGCLITNSSLECPTSGDEIARKIAAGISRQESAIYRVLRRAQAEGSLPSTLDARALARFFLGVAHGLNVVNKTVGDPEMLKDMAGVAMNIWDNADRTRQRPAGQRSSRRTLA